MHALQLCFHTSLMNANMHDLHDGDWKHCHALCLSKTDQVIQVFLRLDAQLVYANTMSMSIKDDL